MRVSVLDSARCAHPGSALGAAVLPVLVR